MTESARVDITQHDVVSIVSQDLGLSHTQSMLDAIQLEAGRLDCDFVHEGDATFVPFELKTALARTIPEANGAIDRDTTLDAILESLSAQGIYLQTGAKTDELLRADARRREQVAAQRQEDGAAFASVDTSGDGNASPFDVAVPRDAAQIVVDVTKDQLIVSATDLIVTCVWRADGYAADVRRIAVKPMDKASDAPESDLYMIVAQDANGQTDRETVVVDNLTADGATEVLVRMRTAIRMQLGVEFIPAEAAEAAAQPMAPRPGAEVASSSGKWKWVPFLPVGVLVFIAALMGAMFAVLSVLVAAWLGDVLPGVICRAAYIVGSSVGCHF